MSDLVDIKCGKCGNPMRVHPPVATRMDNGLVSSFSLVPSWSPEERKCRVCGALNAPAIQPTLQYGWMAFEPAKEESRIVTPGPLPLDVVRKLKTG